MNRSEYEAIDAVNWSRLKLMRISPFHYASHTPKKPTPAMLIGSAADCLVLEPRLFADKFAVYPGERRGNAWKDFKAENSARTILNQTESDTAKEIAHAVNMNPTARALLAQGSAQKVLTWTDAETGIKCKGIADYVGRRLSDLKTTAAIEPRRFGRHAAEMGYHCQLALYADGLAANGIETEGDPALIVAQNCRPYDSIVYTVPEDIIEAGRTEYRRLLRRLAECMESCIWPGVDEGQPEVPLVLPSWAYDDGEDIELTMGGKPLEVSNA